jgi:hypothetical protein
MIARTVSVWTILSLVGVLSAVLIGHLWDRYSQETEVLGFSGIYERYLASQAGFGDDAQAYRACHMLAWSMKRQLWKSMMGAYLLP